MALLISLCVVIENMKSENRKLTQKVRSIDIYILIKYILIKRSKNEQPIVCKIMLQISVDYLGYIFKCVKKFKLSRSCREIRPSIVKNIVIINNSIERKSLASK